jgi:hypothetical protein
VGTRFIVLSLSAIGRADRVLQDPATSCEEAPSACDVHLQTASGFLLGLGVEVQAITIRKQQMKKMNRLETLA